MKKPAYVAINPDDDLVFNSGNQTVFFNSLKGCREAIKEELDEMASVDGNGKVYTMAEENDWHGSDYRIFKEIS